MLDKLWDDTVAGPRPESGLGKLRKFEIRSSSSKGMELAGDTAKSYHRKEAGDEAVRVSRKIMIMKPPGIQAGSTPPVSPAGSTPPVSPFAGSSGEVYRFRRAAYEKKEAAVIPETTRAGSTSYP